MNTPSQEIISAVCKDIENLLLEKNRKYGDSALNPKRIFSKASPIEQLMVRIDDKISRIENAANDEDEDPITDLIGYLILLKAAYLISRSKATPLTTESEVQRERLADGELKFTPTVRFGFPN